MKAYPVSTELRDAIERLFDDPSIAFTALGTDLQDSQQFSVSGSDRSISPAKRAKMLRTRLEEFYSANGGGA